MGSDLSPVDELVERLERRVEERRAAGDYPDGLEEELDTQFRRILAFRHELDLRAGEHLAALGSLPRFERSRISLESEGAVGRLVHRLVARLTARQVQGVLDQAQDHADALAEVIGDLVGSYDELLRFVDAELAGRFANALDEIAEQQRSIASLRSVVERLEARIAELEGPAAATAAEPG